jgi:hypothetical protein
MGSVKRIDLKDFAKELGDFAKASLEKKQKAVASGLARSIPDLVAASPVDTGLYAQSWDFTMTERSGIIGNYAPYAGIIEYGTRPFWPPLAPLLEWAKRVLTKDAGRFPKARKTGQRESGYSPEVVALARYTQRKIAKYGMTPRHIMENMIPKIIENIRQEMQRIV